MSDDRPCILLGRLADLAHDVAGWLLAAMRVVSLGHLPPVVGVGGVVVRDGQVLMLRRYDGRYTLPGGAMRYGETCDLALQRELLEETGVQVAVETLIGIYSGPVPSRNIRAVVIVYRCRWLEGELRGSYEGCPDWLSLDDLPPPHMWALGSRKAVEDMLSGEINPY